MLKSEIVEVDGVFVGAAIRHPDRPGLAFFATHERVRPLHGAVLPNLAALRHQAARHYRGVSSTAETIVVSQAVRPETGLPNHSGSAVFSQPWPIHPRNR